MNHPLEAELEARWSVAKWRGVRMLVAVSGGADSVALLRAMLQAAGESGRKYIEVAHYNHGWRGAASDADEQFVRDLCSQLQVQLVVERATTSASDGNCDRPESRNARIPRSTAGRAKKTSKSKFEKAAETPGEEAGVNKWGPSIQTEENARAARYAFLVQTAYRSGARYVLTGHTAGDRVETLLHNLFRGTGLAGASTPSLTRPLDRDLVLVRPLIGSWREQVEDYLRHLGQDYRIDGSNSDITYRRNFLRHQLLPLLRETYGPGVDQRLSSFSELTEEALHALRCSATEYLRLVEALRRDGGLVGAQELLWLPTLAQLDFPWVVVREGICLAWQQRGWKLQNMSREHWEQLREVMQEELPDPRQASLNLPGDLVARREGNWLRIALQGD